MKRKPPEKAAFLRKKAEMRHFLIDAVKKIVLNSALDSEKRIEVNFNFLEGVLK